eukprot:473930_1
MNNNNYNPELEMISSAEEEILVQELINLEIDITVVEEEDLADDELSEQEDLVNEKLKNMNIEMKTDDIMNNNDVDMENTNNLRKSKRKAAETLQNNTFNYRPYKVQSSGDENYENYRAQQKYQQQHGIRIGQRYT